MNTVKFSAAKAVFVPIPPPAGNSVNQYGFYHALDLSDYASNGTYIAGGPSLERAVMRLTARNTYRLYINGEIVAHGPARTAHGYCRVDEVDVTEYLTDSINHLAVEVIEYDPLSPAYNHYSNNFTMEPGLLTAELEVDGEILAATGRDVWQYCRIEGRAPFSDRISHSRECTEIYTLTDQYYLWKLGVGHFLPDALVEHEPIYLAHEALMPTLKESPFNQLLDFGACRIDQSKPVSLNFYQNNDYHPSLPEHPTDDCRRSVELPTGRVRAEYGSDGLTLTPAHTADFYAMWDGGESRVGFIRLAVTCARAGIIDIAHSELLSTDGSIAYDHQIVTRLHVPAGLTEFVMMEPTLARYVQIFFRGVGTTTVHSLTILDDSYPDEHCATFLCSDENINRLYNAAKLTMRLNTLDIFMDCPQRERGGWLCDSLWTGRAAALMLADHRVEREYLENFLLTPAESMGHAFFPEVYPANKETYLGIPGISTWSFWLMCEVCEFIRRTGDLSFRDEHKARIVSFVKGTKDFIGPSGLLENLPAVFIDWSMSNREEYHAPVSTAVNALFAYMMIELGKVFEKPRWVAEGRQVRSILRKAILGDGTPAELSSLPDAFDIDAEGRLRAKDLYSEAAVYTALWSGLFEAEEAPNLVRRVRDTMGPAPVFAKDPNVGASQLFIGLCIRLDMLCRQGYYDKMFEELSAIYEPQLREGPGTLWEVQSINASSRCHGFNGHAGVHLMRDVLGLGTPTFAKNGVGDLELIIAPHTCGLRWAKGTVETPEGIVTVSWKYDGDSFTLRATIPAGVGYRVELPREVKGLDERRVSVMVTEY